LPAEKPSTEVTPKKVVVAQPKRRPQRARTKFKAEDLLKQANGLRRVQDWNRAARAYAVVGKKFRGSDSEYVALVSEAEIQLRQLSNIERAKKCYERALSLRPAGVLGAEILFGLAEVSGLENNHAEETRFLRRLIEKYEHSPFADLAKDRLEQQ
jgi:tetratricopeptide (TPR) repeat protein